MAVNPVEYNERTRTVTLQTHKLANWVRIQILSNKREQGAA